MIANLRPRGLPVRWVPISTIHGEERSQSRPLQHLREFMAVTGRARCIVRSGRKA